MAELTIKVAVSEKTDADGKRNAVVTLCKRSPLKMPDTQVVRATVDAEGDVEILGDLLSSDGAQMIETAILECL